MNVTFREYREGDEPELIELWSRCRAPYGGYVARTPEWWRWSVFQLHALTPSSIVIATEDEEILGYAALTSGGKVVDFVVDSRLRRRRRRAAARALVENVEDRARRLSCDRITFTGPSTDTVIDGVLREMDYVVDQRNSLMLGILNPAALIDALLSHPDHGLPVTWTRRILLDTPPGNYQTAAQSKILIVVERGKATAADASGTTPEDIEWHFRIDYGALTDLIFCRTTFRALLDNGGIEVVSNCPVADAERFFSALPIRSDWFVPEADSF